MSAVPTDNKHRAACLVFPSVSPSVLLPFPASLGVVRAPPSPALHRCCCHARGSGGHRRPLVGEVSLGDGAAELRRSPPSPRLGACVCVPASAGGAPPVFTVAPLAPVSLPLTRTALLGLEHVYQARDFYGTSNLSSLEGDTLPVPFS